MRPIYESLKQNLIDIWSKFEMHNVLLYLLDAIDNGVVCRDKPSLLISAPCSYGTGVDGFVSGRQRPS